MRGYRLADWGPPEDICNRAGKALFKKAALTWTLPRQWSKDSPRPFDDKSGPALYVVLREHGNARSRAMIEYIGLATDVGTRFYNHPKAKALRDTRGQTFVSIAPIDFVRGRDRLASQKAAMEEIEHLLIWTLDPPMNDRKHFSLPAMGLNGGNAWHIENRGYRFAGRMPREIVFPWMALRAGRNRTLKT